MHSTVVRGANYKYWAYGAIAIGTFASVVDYGSVNIALPRIAEHFQTDLPSVQWVVIGYALTISAFLLPMGRLADLLGRRNVYIAGSLVFVLGAALASLSPNLGLLVLFRILQGIGAAMTQGTGMAIIASTFPANERGKAIGLIMTVVGTGGVAGPAVGGLLVSALDWRWVFFFNVPLGLLAVAAGLAILGSRRASDEGRGEPERGFDWLGAGLSSGVLITFLLVVTNGHRAGWTSPAILASVLVFVALLAGFIWWELRTPGPMLDLRLFQRRTFSFGTSAAFLIFLGSSAVLFLMPHYLQKILGYSPLEAGLIVVPSALCMAVLGPVSGRLSDRYGWRRFTVGGLGLSAAGLLLLSRLTESSSLLQVLPALILTSSGMGVFFSPNSSSVLSAVEGARYGVISAFLNLIRNAATVTSIAAATAVVTATMAVKGFEPSLDAVQAGEASQAFILGLRYAFLSMMGVLIVAMAVSAFKFEQAQRAVTPPTPEPRTSV